MRPFLTAPITGPSTLLSSLTLLAPLFLLTPACGDDSESCPEGKSCEGAGGTGTGGTGGSGASGASGGGGQGGDGGQGGIGGGDGGGGGNPASCTPEVGAPPNASCGLFANPALATGGDGTMKSPYGNLAEALAEAAAHPEKRLYLCGHGDMPHGATLGVPAGITLLGGFTCTDFSRSEVLRPVLVGPANLPVLLIDSAGDPDVETTISGLSVRAPDATTVGRSSIGLILSQGGKLSWSDGDITAGAGAPGTDGANAPAVPATQGLDGGPGAAPPLCGTDFLSGPNGQTRSCDNNTSTTGGNAGDSTDSQGTDGTDGMPDLGLGTGGIGQPGSGPWSCGIGPGLGGANAGNDGSAGIPGEASLAYTWDLDTFALKADGGPGTPGAPGQGGGGGGGSRGRADCDPGAGGLQPQAGATGGAGGTGGCGGLGGAGGTSGGSSIALLLLGGASASLESASLTTDDAGKGGDGGAGQPGGFGGTGGAGGPGDAVAGITSGCPGGLGGAGGRGAGGAGGRGGTSAAIVKDASSTATFGDEVTLTLGKPGTGGGPGGAINPGAPGLAGIACTTLILGATDTCEPTP